MKQVLLSSVLVGLLSVGSNLIQAEELTSNIVFDTAGITKTPSDGVYEVSSGAKTLSISNGVVNATIFGGLNANSGTIDVKFGGGISGSEFQIFSFGSSSSDDSRTIKTNNGGKISFAFAEGALGAKNNYYIISTATNSSITNSSSGEIDFNFGDFSFSKINTTVENEKGAVMNFKFGDYSTFDIEDKTVTNSGTMVFDFTNANETDVGGIFVNQSDSPTSDLEKASIKLKFLNAQNIFFGNNNPFSLSNQDADNKKGIVFSFEGNSFVAFNNVALANITFDFKGDRNTLDLGQGISASNITTFNAKWFNSVGKNNITSLVALDDTGTPNTAILELIRNKFAFLEIGDSTSQNSGISGNGMNFIVYANISKRDLLGQEIKPDSNNNYTYSDRVIIHSSQDNATPTSHNLGVIVAPSMLKYLDSVSYTPKSDTEKGDTTTKGNIAVASVANTSNVKFNALSGTLLGFNLIETSFEEVQTNAEGVIDGTNGYTTYFLKSAQDSGVAPITQEVTSSVFALNYDLFIANFNSLNKRMGDLRNNPYSQGAWGRIFNGQLSNDFGLGSSNNYTTLQAGYDYDFTLTNAKNYLGVAFAYGFSISEMSSNASNALQSREIKDIFSNNIELALYNAYVEDSGLYSDSIAKFSYLLSNFNLTNNGVSESLNVNNYALQLSEEVGYVFTLGESKEWSITPQAELSFGYYSDSDLTQVAGDFYLDAKAKSMLMLRARVGAMVGYDFKQYTQDKDITTTLYAGLSYEYDYLSGGDIELTPNVGKATTTKSALSSDGRGVLNLGTNITLKDDIRLYADFQTSFGGKINTDYQINIGARFSFGERGEEQKDREEAPLKIEG